MRLFFRYIIIFLIINYKWILVESTGSSATPPASSGGATDSSNKTGVELSLKATDATDQFDYNKVDKVVTYTAKDGFGFSSVKTKTGGSSCGSSCGGSDLTIWDAKDASEYATKVVLYGKGQKEKIVTIHIPNDTKKVYKRDGKGKPWQEFDLSKTYPVSIRVNTQSDSCVHTYKKEHKIGTFTPKEGFVFNEVIWNYAFGGETIWKTDKESEYANKVEMEGDKKAKIHFKDGSVKVFRLGEGTRWKEYTQDSTQKSTTDGSGGTDQSGGGKTGNDGSGGDGSTHTGGGSTHTGGSGTGTPGGGGTQANQTSGGGTTGTDGSGGGGTQQSTPSTQ